MLTFPALCKPSGMPGAGRRKGNSCPAPAAPGNANPRPRHRHVSWTRATGKPPRDRIFQGFEHSGIEQLCLWMRRNPRTASLSRDVAQGFVALVGAGLPRAPAERTKGAGKGKAGLWKEEMSPGRAGGRRGKEPAAAPPAAKEQRRDGIKN